MTDARLRDFVLAANLLGAGEHNAIETLDVRRVVLAKGGLARLRAWGDRVFGLRPDIEGRYLLEGVRVNGVHFVEEPAQATLRGAFDGRFYYAYGEVMRAPREAAPGRISLGFRVCSVDPSGTDPGVVGPVIAEALNRMLDAGDLDR